jgi:chromate reductase
LVGSLAKQSINRKLAQTLVRLAPDTLDLHQIPFAQLPLHSYDHDADYPQVRATSKPPLRPPTRSCS